PSLMLRSRSNTTACGTPRFTSTPNRRPGSSQSTRMFTSLPQKNWFHAAFHDPAPGTPTPSRPRVRIATASGSPSTIHNGSPLGATSGQGNNSRLDPGSDFDFGLPPGRYLTTPTLESFDPTRVLTGK